MINNAWFKANQDHLVKVANTPTGRQILGIRPDLPDIVVVRPNSVTAQLSESEYVSQFRTHAKHAKLLRLRWDIFQQYAAHLELVRPGQIDGLLLPQAGLMVATVSTFRPDPDPETSTVDGYAQHRITSGDNDVPYSTLVAGAGTDAGGDQAWVHLSWIQAGTNTDEYHRNRRGLFLFDTSSIPDGDSISAAEIQFVIKTVAGSDELDGGGHDNSRIHIVSSNPASNTALVAGDYDSLGSTSFGNSVIQDDNPGVDETEIITLNASGIAAIDKSGITKFGTKVGWDLNDTTTGLTWTSDGSQAWVIYSADNTGTSDDPVLEVTHGVLLERHYPRHVLRGVLRGAIR